MITFAEIATVLSTLPPSQSWCLHLAINISLQLGCACYSFFFMYLSHKKPNNLFQAGKTYTPDIKNLIKILQAIQLISAYYPLITSTHIGSLKYYLPTTWNQAYPIIFINSHTFSSGVIMLVSNVFTVKNGVKSHSTLSAMYFPGISAICVGIQFNLTTSPYSKS